MGNKRKIKVESGDRINYLCGYFCCTDILLMSMCRIAVLNNNLQWVVWVSLGCHGPDCSSSSSSKSLTELDRNYAVILFYKTNPDSKEMRGSEQTAVSKQRWSCCLPQFFCFPATLILLIDKELNIGWALRLERAGIWGVSCYTALSWFDHYGNM